MLEPGLLQLAAGRHVFVENVFDRVTKDDALGRLCCCRCRRHFNTGRSAVALLY